MQIDLKIKKISEYAKLPFYATEGAAGMDLYAANEIPIVLKPLDRGLIPLGFSMELPSGYEAQIRPRSGMAIKHGITLSNCVGTVDEDYRGEVCVGLINLSEKEYTIYCGDRIAQMVIAPVVKANIIETEELDETERGKGGFGSTGLK
ncbi:MAG: dUTP diphosphatase [Candidatus Gastranaerophilales bacterium]|nr:dUTP diphosphatase [Candidatus Gastranaerophilales bacterium]